MSATQRVDAAYFESRSAAREQRRAGIDALWWGLLFGLSASCFVQAAARCEVMAERHRAAQLKLGVARADEAREAAEQLARDMEKDRAEAQQDGEPG